MMRRMNLLQDRHVPMQSLIVGQSRELLLINFSLSKIKCFSSYGNNPKTGFIFLFLFRYLFCDRRKRSPKCTVRIKPNGICNGLFKGENTNFFEIIIFLVDNSCFEGKCNGRICVSRQDKVNIWLKIFKLEFLVKFNGHSDFNGLCRRSFQRRKPRRSRAF